MLEGYQKCSKISTVDIEMDTIWLDIATVLTYLKQTINIATSEANMGVIFLTMLSDAMDDQMDSYTEKSEVSQETN